MKPNVNRAPSATMPAAVALLQQCRACLGQVSDEQYTASCATMFGATIGQHMRHTLDHFIAAMDALEDETIDYDHRERDTDVEKQRRIAMDTIDTLCALLQATPVEAADRLVTVRVMLSPDGQETELTSSFARELAFATHHAIHHNAMIAVIAHEMGITMPNDFGKAPSSIAYEHARLTASREMRG